MIQNYIHCKLEGPRHATWILTAENHRRYQHGGHEAEEMGNISFSFVADVESPSTSAKITDPPFDLAPNARKDPLCAKHFQ